jgi:hypothetical protein
VPQRIECSGEGFAGELRRLGVRHREGAEPVEPGLRGDAEAKREAGHGDAPQGP